MKSHNSDAPAAFRSRMARPWSANFGVLTLDARGYEINRRLTIRCLFYKGTYIAHGIRCNDNDSIAWKYLPISIHAIFEDSRVSARHTP